MRRLCLDTSAYSHFKRGHADSVEAIIRASAVSIPAVVLGELRAGFRMGRNSATNEHELEAFLSSSAVHVLALDDEVASIYADLVLDLRRSATPLPTNDIWIAACAIRDGSTVLTYDAHFKEIQRVGSIVLRA
jgi:tRNA(fMet)-specific endonuclease VapC